MASNAGLQNEQHDVSMPTILDLEASDSHEALIAEIETVADQSKSQVLVMSQSSSKTGSSKLEAALTTPRTILIQKPATSADKSLSTSVSNASVTGKVNSPQRQLQFLCENDHVVAAPQAVSQPNVASVTSEEPAQHSTALAPVDVVEEQPEEVVILADAALPVTPATPATGASHVDTTRSVEPATETLPPEPADAEWVVEVENTGGPDDAVTRGEQQTEVANTGDRVKVHTVDPADVLDAVEAAEAVTRIEATEAVTRIEAVPQSSRLVLNTAGALVESSTAAAVLDAVESAAGSAAAVSHVVFESDGRAVGALLPAPGEDGQQGKQQVVLTGQQGDQQVVLAVDGDVLRTAGASDGRNIVLQVDEASDSVTLLVNRPAKETIYELATEKGELLELWERDSSGKDRHLETVTEVSLVDIRAVCEQCGCAISHHMVGLLARADGSEYGYRCRLCQCVQTDVDVMARHMDSHRPLADTQCRFCSRGLRTFRPQASRTYTCHACQLVFVSRHEMIKHREIHPPKRRFPCELCDKAFQMKVQLEVHMRTHLGHKPYACDMCPATFTQPSHLINHRRTHTGERPYSCERCGRAFVQQGHLRAHERTHTGERPYKCDICGRGFRQSGQLTAHKKLHEGDAPFKLRRRHGEPIAEEEITCRVCKKTFKLPKDLKRHALIHTEGAFRCETCNRSFKRADHLRRHLRRHENPQKPRRRRRARPSSADLGAGEQPEGLTMLDHVIDSVLDDPQDQESTGSALKMQEDGLKEAMDGREGTANDANSDDGMDQQGDVEEEDPDSNADVEAGARRTRISRAPEDALWSQADCSDDVRWQRVEQLSGRRPSGKTAFGRRSRLLHTPLTDDGVDDEMAMLTAALRERTTTRKPKRGRATARGRAQHPEPTVKLEPVESWEGWESGESVGQHDDDGYLREHDRNWRGTNRQGASGRRKCYHDGGTKLAEDLVLAVWDDADVVETGSDGTARRSGARSKDFPAADHVPRTSRRSTAGNRAANVGVSLSRSSRHEGKR